jgi:hypothetical protein
MAIISTANLTLTNSTITGFSTGIDIETPIPPAGIPISVLNSLILNNNTGIFTRFTPVLISRTDFLNNPDYDFTCANVPVIFTTTDNYLFFSPTCTVANKPYH